MTTFDQIATPPGCFACGGDPNLCDCGGEGSDQKQTRPDGSVIVTETVASILAALAADLDNDLDNIRNGKGDPLASIENTAANLRLLASGTWGAGTAMSSD